MAEKLAIKEGGNVSDNGGILEYAFVYVSGQYTYGNLVSPSSAQTTGTPEIRGEYLSIKFISGQGWYVTVNKKCSVIRNNVRIDNVSAGTEYHPIGSVNGTPQDYGVVAIK